MRLRDWLRGRMKGGPKDMRGGGVHSGALALRPKQLLGIIS